MDKVKRNYWIDILMFISIAITAVTGIVLFIILPSGKRSGWETFLGITKAIWVDVHTWAGLIFIALVLIHLILHWKWILAMTKNFFRK